MIVIDLAEAVTLARSLEIRVDEEVARIEEHMFEIGEKLADRLGVELHSAELEEAEFAGAALAFTGERGQRCPEELLALDPEGELASAE